MVHASGLAEIADFREIHERFGVSYGDLLAVILELARMQREEPAHFEALAAGK